MKDSTVVNLDKDKIIKNFSSSPIRKRLEDQERKIKELYRGITCIYIAIAFISIFIVVFSTFSSYKTDKLRTNEEGMRNEIETLKEMLAEVLVSRKKSYYFIPQKERRISYGN